MLESFFALLLGLIIGSFLNVCIYRMPRDLSVVRPRSFCPACEAQISWFDNIPVVSYLYLHGRCRSCGASIPARYPIVEVLTAALFFLIVSVYGPVPLAAKLCLFAVLSVGLLFSDLEERILPDEFTLGGTVAGLLLTLWIPMDPGPASWFLPRTWNPRWLSFAEAAFGAVFSSGALWLIGEFYYRVRNKEGLGLGDVKMMAMVGSFLGIYGSLMTMMFGSILGSLIGLLYIVFARKDASTYELPFGTFLGAAAIVVAVAGEPFWHWYMGLAR